MPDDATDHTAKPLVLADFDYPFPEHLVAQAPQPERDAARMLVRQRDGRLNDAHIFDLPSELAKGTLLILNASRVFPSRLIGRLPSGGQVELFLLRPLEPTESNASCRWQALGRPLKKLKAGRTVHLAAGVIATILGRTEDGSGTAFVGLEFNLSGRDFAEWLERHGTIPLPPYIKRTGQSADHGASDRERYQTVYANEVGSVAAPTAGLHFTADLLAQLEQRGIEIRYVSLHVGAGTFLPVKAQDPSHHHMHAEPYCVGRDTALAVCRARAEDRRIVAVGTTTLRSLEDLYRRAQGDQEEFVTQAGAWHETQLYLHPLTAEERYRPWVIDGLITNYHQPCSTLFMLISYLIGLPNAKELYAQAIARQYRLYSYGDASLLWL